MQRVLAREETAPVHALSLTVTMDCGHSFTVHGLAAQKYRQLDTAPCEACYALGHTPGFWPRNVPVPLRQVVRHG